ncbi:hypothetical protein THF1C08_320128 [Vibrio jasicida]|uniref:Uncharacterized protein n=1 Tax=Vibrio jasicida TaxID=766224 RepID=A0AAU9QRE6_9VIBR|nr:hypothetical protein THF1C08_320128 [Vibrio jasicida]CAH1597625.1 hypothetical protein THF1A12_320130 [Vibrio jasicida]
MKANLKTQTFDDWNAANDFMKKLDAKGLEHTAFPVPNSTDYVVAWAELSEDKQSLTIKDWAISDALRIFIQADHPITSIEIA